MKAKELMVPIQDYLNPDDTVKHAVNLLRTARRGEDKIGAKGLPVLDEFKKPIGMVSMRDVLKAAVPFYMTMMDLGDFSWDGMVEEIAERSADKKIKDVMSSVVIKVEEDAPLMQCIDQMVRHNIKRLPVVNEVGQVVGMLYERDIFFAVTKAMIE